jgi:hypothetical protein
LVETTSQQGLCRILNISGALASHSNDHTPSLIVTDKGSLEQLTTLAPPETTFNYEAVTS